MEQYVCRLESILKTRGITQHELAKKCGITAVTINRYVNKKRIPNVIDAGKIAACLNLEIGEIWYVL